jgi:hypothetical protein
MLNWGCWLKQEQNLADLPWLWDLVLTVLGLGGDIHVSRLTPHWLFRYHIVVQSFIKSSSLTLHSYRPPGVAEKEPMPTTTSD